MLVSNYLIRWTGPTVVNRNKWVLSGLRSVLLWISGCTTVRCLVKYICVPLGNHNHPGKLRLLTMTRCEATPLIFTFTSSMPIYQLCANKLLTPAHGHTPSFTLTSDQYSMVLVSEVIKKQMTSDVVILSFGVPNILCVPIK